jgi:hypothetical protein
VAEQTFVLPRLAFRDNAMERIAATLRAPAQLHPTAWLSMGSAFHILTRWRHEQAWRRRTRSDTSCTRTWALPSNPETAVHAHHPKSTGIDQKSLDICGAWTCHTCHSAVDGRIDTGFSRDELALCTEEAFRTISELH